MLDWFYTAIAWVMKQWHALFSTFLDPAGGITWALSIMMLVVTIRVLLFRLFIRQVKSQRAMQELQPEIQKLRKQYGSDRQGMATAQQQLFKDRGVNPLAGCLPILPQIPVFIALLHVLRRLQPGANGLYSWSNELTDQAAKATLFGAPISSAFNMKGAKADALFALPGVSQASIHIVALTLMVIMCVTTFFTQKQIMRRSGPVEGQAAMVQKLMLYGMPIGLFTSGFFFPIGVLLYWFTNNLWTLGQQFYILRKLPLPNSPAALAKQSADKPAIDPKTLAPKPGAKPVRGKGGRPVTPPPATAGPVLNGQPLDTGGKPAIGTGDGTAVDSGDGAGSGAPPPTSGSSGSGRASSPGARPPKRKRR